MKDMEEMIKDSDDKNGIVNGVDPNRLRSYVERVERLQEDIKGLQTDIKEIFEEAKAAGFDVKGIKALLKIRKLDPNERQEQEFIVDVYRKALGL